MMKYLHTFDKRIVDEDNNEVLLEGYGAGNWMIQEAYLFGSGSFHGEFKPFMRAEAMDRPRTIDQIIRETCGSSYAKTFWNTYYRNYLTNDDIQYMKSLGFNSIRLPLVARLFIEEEEEIVFNQDMFDILDNVIKSCRENEMYVILDMHAAITSQSGIGCDDGVDNSVHLFVEEESMERTILLWERLAHIYKDEPCIAGYELLNEPLALPKWDYMIPLLLDFYQHCIQRIRKIDQKHIIFLQGHRFAKRADIFQRDMDPLNNWVLTMHIYEDLPDMGIIGPILEERERLDVPVWIGETGGSKHWTVVMYDLLRRYHMGYNVFTYKAVYRKNACTLATYVLPEGFSKIVNYALKGSAKPTFKESREIFNRYLEAIKFASCTLQEQEANAILRKNNVSIPAIGYDIVNGPGKDYSGTYPYCSFSGYRRECHMQMVLEQPAYDQGDFKHISSTPVPKYGDYNNLMLVLHKDEFVSYTLREHNYEGDILVHMKGEHCILNVQLEDEYHTIYVDGVLELKKIYLCHFHKLKNTKLSIRVCEGSLIMKTIMIE